MSFKVKLSSRTWIKDNYNLFDYDLDKDLNQKELTIKNEGIFSRKVDDTFFYNKAKKSGQQNDISQMTTEDKKLLQIKFQDNHVKIYPPEEKDQLLWKVVPRSETDYVTVDLNDTIKIGKKQFTILQINLSSHKQMLEIENHYHISNIMNTFISDADLMDSSATVHESPIQSYDQPHEKQQEKPERMPCRICLSSSCSRKNPLLAPCNCKGSARWIHYDCVQQWINQRIQISEKQYYANIKSRCIKCELCMTLLPPTIKLHDQVYNLYQFKNLKFDKFIVMEDADGLIYMLNFTNKNTFNIGRGHNCDIKLSEITVSRKHLKLEVDKDNKIRIFDINSKFGTLVLIKKPLSVQYDQYLELQNGRTHIKIKRIEKKSRLRQFFNLCYCKKEEVDYSTSKPTNRQLKQQIDRDREYEQLNQDEEAAAQRERSRVIDENNQQQSPNINPLSASQQYLYLPVAQQNVNLQDQTGDTSANAINQSNYRSNTNVHQDILQVQRSQSAMLGNRRLGSLMNQNSQRQLNGNSPAANFIEIDEVNEQQNRNQINIQQLATQQHQSQPLLMPLSIHQESVNEQMIYEEEDDYDAHPTSSRRRIRIEQSGSVPIIIPHSNSAPTNFDFIPPFVGFR